MQVELDRVVDRAEPTVPGAVRVPSANSRIALRSCTTAPVRSDHARVNASTVPRPRRLRQSRVRVRQDTRDCR